MSSIQTSEDIVKEAMNKEKQSIDDNDPSTEKGICKEMTEVEEITTEEEITTDEENITDEEISTNEEISTDEANMTDEEIMTDEELEQFRRKTFDYLRETAVEVVSLESLYDQGGKFVIEVQNAVITFNNSFFELTKTVRENIEKFRRDIAQLMIETKYFNLNCEIVMHTHKKGWHLEVDKDKEKHSLLDYSMSTLVNFSDSCDNFAMALANEPGFVEIVKQCLEDFLPKYFSKGEESKLGENERSIVVSALTLAHNMSMRESNVSKLRDTGMISCLKPYVKSQNNEHALSALACLAGIINEKECDIIDSNKHVVKYLLDCMRKGLKDKMRDCDGWSCKECGLIIKLLARNDANMKTLVDLGALELLVELGRTGDEDEQYESVSALWALCFDKENQTLITGTPELGVVDILVEFKSSENAKIRKACNGALWILRDALKETVVEKYKKISEQFVADRDKTETRYEKEKQVTSEDNVTSKGHVMISYQWADQEVLKNIRNKIKARGYKVWIDIDQMEGSTLQAMAEAVEGAGVILMCMSNKYKHSPNCRAEAEYAYQLRKNIIPLKMERGYAPDGWLGFIVGAKLYFEFSGKYPFEEKMKALIKEIESFLGRTWDMPDSGEIIAPTIASVTGAHSAVSHADTASTVRNTVTRISVSETIIDIVRKWTADDVKRWIEKNDLQKCGINSLTGGQIALLANMRVECPEFFYKCLQDMLKIKDLLTMSKVVFALHDLS